MKYPSDRVRNILKSAIQVNSIEFVGNGNHSEAFCINDELVVKFPKHKKASECLKTEMLVLRGLAQKTQMDIPNVVFEGSFDSDNEIFVYFASKRLPGKKLSKPEFVSLDEKTDSVNAEKIARFLYQVHNERHILPIKRKDLTLLHGDFSLNHILFNENNIVCGVLDFGDSRVGKPMSDFIYLLDDDDGEEFGAEFGERVLKEYIRLSFAAGRPIKLPCKTHKHMQN